MRLNKNAAILNEPILLVPYLKHHVKTYHEWMQDEETRTQTASDLLTLDEEYSNQVSWREDAEKLTFIICTTALYTSRTRNHDESKVVKAEQDDAPDAMVGDVNLFLNDYAEPESTTSSASESKPRPLIGEINIMVARRELRRMGFGRIALKSFLSYVWANRCAVVKEFEQTSDPNSATKCQLCGFQAKIDAENVASIKLFESIGFMRTSENPNYFGEVELRMLFDEAPNSTWENILVLRYASSNDDNLESRNS